MAFDPLDYQSPPPPPNPLPRRLTARSEALLLYIVFGFAFLLMLLPVTPSGFADFVAYSGDDRFDCRERSPAQLCRHADLVWARVMGEHPFARLYRVNDAGSGSRRLPPQSLPHAAVKAPDTSKMPARMLDRYGLKTGSPGFVTPSPLKARRPHAATIWKLDLDLHPAHLLHSISAEQIT